NIDEKTLPIGKLNLFARKSLNRWSRVWGYPRIASNNFNA
ncbi:unnamed protein product, partial [marine sediment metagenome]